MSSKKIKILASFDDGDQLDMTLADMLIKYRIPAVFYIPVKTRDLMDNQVRKLAGTEPNCEMCKITKDLFEVGAHTMTHPREFNSLSDSEVMKEVAGSKTALEYLIGKPVTKFCYPRGRYNDRIKEIVKNVGFLEARTVKGACIDFPKDPFETRPTVHVMPVKLYDIGNNLERHDDYEKKQDLITWTEYAKVKFDEVIENGGRFEMWGHSWEIEKYNQWEFLEDFLIYMDEKMKKINYPRLISIPYFEIK